MAASSAAKARLALVRAEMIMRGTELRPATPPAARVAIRGGIDSWTARRARSDIAKATLARRAIVVEINSEGGMCADAFAIADALDQAKKLGISVDTVAQAVCASAATMLFALGDTRYCDATTEFMFHRAANSTKRGTAAFHQRMLGAVAASDARLFATVRRACGTGWSARDLKLWDAGEDVIWRADMAQAMGFVHVVTGRKEPSRLGYEGGTHGG